MRTTTHSKSRLFAAGISCQQIMQTLSAIVSAPLDIFGNRAHNHSTSGPIRLRPDV